MAVNEQLNINVAAPGAEKIPGIFEQIGHSIEKANAAGKASFLEKLDSLGKRGGALYIGTELAGKFAERMREAAELSIKYRMGQASLGDIGEKVMGGIPGFGQGWEIGRSIREMVTGEEAKLKIMERQTEELSRFVELQKQQRDLMKDVRTEFERMGEKTEMATELIGADPLKAALGRSNMGDLDRANAIEAKMKAAQKAAEEKYNKMIAEGGMSGPAAQAAFERDFKDIEKMAVEELRKSRLFGLYEREEIRKKIGEQISASAAGAGASVAGIFSKTAADRNKAFEQAKASGESGLFQMLGMSAQSPEAQQMMARINIGRQMAGVQDQLKSAMDGMTGEQRAVAARAIEMIPGLKNAMIENLNRPLPLGALPTLSESGKLTGVADVAQERMARQNTDAQKEANKKLDALNKQFVDLLKRLDDFNKGKLVLGVLDIKR